MRHRLLLVLTATLTLSALPALADELPPIDEYVPTFARADLWLHANSSPVGNVDANEGRYLKWDATKPTAATPALYNGFNYNRHAYGDHRPVDFLTMQGKMKGDLDAIAFDLFFTGWAQFTLGCELSLSFDLKIDGQDVLYQGYAGSAGIRYQSVDEKTQKTRFVLSNLWEASKQLKLAYGPDVEHDVYLNVQNFYACNELSWYYDSASNPSGMIVNLPTDARAGYTDINVLEPPPPLTS